MRSFFKNLKSASSSALCPTLWGLTGAALLLPATALSTPCSHGIGQYRHVPTSLESAVGDQPVLSFTQDYFGNTWIGTQSGLIKAEAANHPSTDIQIHTSNTLSNHQVIALRSSPPNTTIEAYLAMIITTTTSS